MHYYRSLPKIKAITFDLDDTLYDNRPVIVDLEQKMLVWMHEHHPKTRHCTRDWWNNIRQQVIQHDSELIHNVTQWRHEQIQLGLKRLGYHAASAKDGADMALVEVMRLRNRVDVPKETHRVLSILADRVPLIAITNGNVDPSRIGLADYFQVVLQAGKNGRSKPFPDLFQVAQHHLSLPAQSILHVGDDLVTDVYGAMKSGYSSCWFNDQGLNLRQANDTRQIPNIEIDKLADLIALV
jgi:putative hydrolase of the HAD superfamily